MGRSCPARCIRADKSRVNHFMHFSRSLAAQRAMVLLVACYVLAMWFLDAFNVIGYLWPNGDRGSGKTQLLRVVAKLSYLGELITSASTFASLRDLADYGACMAFDDAENMAEGKDMDSNKRSLLLAGNRRDATVTLKEPVTRQNVEDTRGEYILPTALLCHATTGSHSRQSHHCRADASNGGSTRSGVDPFDEEVWPVRSI